MTPQTATGLRPREEQSLGEIADRAAPGVVAERFPLVALPLPAPVSLPPAGLISVPMPGTGAGAGSRPAAWRMGLQRRALGAADVASVILALTFVLTLFGKSGAAVLDLVAVPLVLLVFKVAGLYDGDELRLVPSTLDETPALLQLTGLIALIVAILQPTMLGGSPTGAQIAALWITSFAAVTAGRLLARSIVRRGSPMEHCLVIGELDYVDRICDRLAASNARATVVACMPLGEQHALRSPDALRQLVLEVDAQRIIIAPGTSEADDLAELIRLAKAAGVSVSVLPRMLQVVGSAIEFDDIDGMTMLGVRRFGLSASSRLLKRAFDIVASVLGLIVVGPVIGAIALAIKVDSNGPVFFRQVRVGRDGRHFLILKFRSMVEDAEARKDDLRNLNEAGDGLFKIRDDPRVTRVGRLLRRTSLDELPQIFNVLRGEMSLVGPRPLVTDEDAMVLGLDRSRLHLTPGMTGPWQVLGSRVPLQEMVGLDYVYVANWSLWLDFKILLRTVRHVARRGNV